MRFGDLLIGYRTQSLVVRILKVSSKMLEHWEQTKTKKISLGI